MELNDLAKTIHAGNVAKGFYDNPVEIGTALMLIVSELGEALEADRKGRHAKLKCYENAQKNEEAFKLFVKDTFEDEIADTLIRTLDLCGYLGIDIDKHVTYKLEYNRNRPYLHGKKY